MDVRDQLLIDQPLIEAASGDWNCGESSAHSLQLFQSSHRDVLNLIILRRSSGGELPPLMLPLMNLVVQVSAESVCVRFVEGDKTEICRGR